MARHDLTLAIAIKGRAGLACGLYASTPVLTATGWVAMADLCPGDLLVTADHGLAPLAATAPETRQALWGVLFPGGALDNEEEVLLPPGQSVLIRSPHAMPFTGEPQALVPAAALEGWRGIAAHVCEAPEPILQIRLPRPALVQVGPGLIVGVEGAASEEVDLIRLLLTAPAHPVLPLAVARHLVALLMAAETGLGLRAAAQLNWFRSEKRA